MNAISGDPYGRPAAPPTFGDRVEDFTSSAGRQRLLRRGGLPGEEVECGGLLSHSVSWLILVALFVLAVLPATHSTLTRAFGDNPNSLLVGKVVVFAVLAYLVVPECSIKS